MTLLLGNLEHLGEFVIPGLGFLYIAGWIGYAGRSYVQANKAGPSLFAHGIPIHNCHRRLKLWPLFAASQGLTGRMNTDSSLMYHACNDAHRYTSAAAVPLPMY
jgi:photosystem I subunit 3